MAREPSKRAFILRMGAGLLIQKLNSSPKGWLLLLALVYIAMFFLGPTRPFLPGELLVWFSDLPSDDKGTLLAALLTVVGFVVALGTAHSTWKKQRYGEMLLQAAEEISEFFGPVVKDANDLAYRADQLTRARNAILSGPMTQEDAWLLDLIAEQSNDTVLMRARIWKASVDVHWLSSKYSIALANQRFATPQMELLIESLTRLAGITYTALRYDNALAVWVTLPYFDHSQEWKAYKDEVDGLTERISGLSGAIRGNFQSTIVNFTPTYLARLLGEVKEMPAEMLAVLLPRSGKRSGKERKPD